MIFDQIKKYFQKNQTYQLITSSELLPFCNIAEIFWQIFLFHRAYFERINNNSSVNNNSSFNNNTRRRRQKKRGRPPKRPLKQQEPSNAQINELVPNVFDKDRCKKFKLFNKCEWDIFQQFLETFQELRIVQLNQDNWKLSTCAKPLWFKHYMCKHIIGIAYRACLFDEFPKES